MNVTGVSVQDSFFTQEELQRFKDLVKLHFKRELNDDEAFDQFHRLFLQIDDIVNNPHNGIIEI